MGIVPGSIVDPPSGNSRSDPSPGPKPVLRVRNVPIEVACVDKDRFDEDQLSRTPGRSIGLTPEVTTTPVGASAAPITLRVGPGRVLSVVDDHILLELDEVDLSVKEPPCSLRFVRIPASCVSEVLFVGILINRSEILNPVVRHEQPEVDCNPLDYLALVHMVPFLDAVSQGFLDSFPVWARRYDVNQPNVGP